MSYELYVVDAHGRSEVILDSHNKNGNRIWVLPEKSFTIVLDHEGFKTYLVLDKNGDMIIEQDEPPPKKKPRRRSRYWDGNRKKYR